MRSTSVLSIFIFAFLIITSSDAIPLKKRQSENGTGGNGMSIKNAANTGVNEYGPVPGGDDMGIETAAANAGVNENGPGTGAVTGAIADPKGQEAQSGSPDTASSKTVVIKKEGKGDGSIGQHTASDRNYGRVYGPSASKTVVIKKEGQGLGQHTPSHRSNSPVSGPSASKTVVIKNDGSTHSGRRNGQGYSPTNSETVIIKAEGST